jgi:hypothetical protein
LFIIDSARIELCLHFEEDLLDVMREGMLSKTCLRRFIGLLFGQRRYRRRSSWKKRYFHGRMMTSNSTIEIAIMRSLCRSQVRIKEECWAEGVQIPPPVKMKRRQKPTTNKHHTNPYRLGRRPGEQGPRPLPSNQGRVEKLATGKHADRRYTTGDIRQETRRD